VIARTEAVRAFNAAKIAALRPLIKPDTGFTVNVPDDFGERLADYMKKTVQQVAKLRVPADTGALRRSFEFTYEKSTHEGEKPMKSRNKLTKVRNRFYVASPNVTRDAEQHQLNVPGAVPLASDHHSSGRWTRPTLEAALNHAREILDTDPNLDHVAVVQIVRVVRRQEMPVTIEVVK